MARKVLGAAGLFAMVMGLLWAGQGAGLVRWPESSFMIGRSNWLAAGLCLAAVGFAMMFAARRFR
jgi:hypothetical protein